MEVLIERVYRETAGALDTIYNKRKRTLSLQRWVWGIAGASFVLLLFMMLAVNFRYMNIAILKQLQELGSNPYAIMYPFAALVVLLYPTTYLFSKAFQKFKIQENRTVASMVKNLFPKADFAQQTRAPFKEVAQSKIFAWAKEDRGMYSYGQLRSKVNDIEVNITDIGMSEENVSNKFLRTLMHIPVLNLLALLYQNVFKQLFSNTTADNAHYTFRGMFCWLRFKKKLNGHTVVLPKEQHTKLDRWASFNFTEEQQIQLEDPRFTQHFTVYGTDQVEARYVLSAALMERVVALNKRFHRPIFLSFQDRQLYLAVANKNGLFSFPAGKLNDMQLVSELAHDIQTALDIPMDLKVK
ncbi:MAG: DUF3137 domain-containing protein [Bacteroidota bacterium]